MAPRVSFHNLAFRVHLTPAPRTQSESNAVLRILHNLGPIATFQIPKNRLASTTETVPYGGSADCVASLVFAKNTRSVRDLRNGIARQNFEVIANANIPDASIQDPYNVRGLKYRKPELPPRTIQVRIVPVEQDQNGQVGQQSEAALSRLAETPYKGTFAVDRNSIFGEILARTDCPSGLIHGLLPKLRDEHRASAWNIESTGAVHEEGRDEHGLQVYQGQRAGRGPTFARLDTERLLREEQYPSSIATAHSEVGGGTVKLHDEFAPLRNVSLMGMYRQAVRSNRETHGNGDGTSSNDVTTKEERDQHDSFVPLMGKR